MYVCLLEGLDRLKAAFKVAHENVRYFFEALVNVELVYDLLGRLVELALVVPTVLFVVSSSELVCIVLAFVFSQQHFSCSAIVVVLVRVQHVTEALLQLVLVD